MNVIENKLLLYPDLSPSEQAEVERYVERHPEWAPALAEARALHDLFRAAHPSSSKPDDAAVADYVLARALGGPIMPERAAQHTFVAAALAADPDLERQAQRLARTLARLAADSEDPAAHFERLTGRRLAPLPEAAPRAPAPRVLRWHPLRLAVAACLALGVLYGALALASHLTRPERALLADLDDLPGNYGGL